MPHFGRDTAQYGSLFNWYGVNLSKTEWPAMRITLNDQVVFDNEFFERCHRYSEKEITLPEDVLVTGCDNSSVSEYSPIKITSFDHPKDEMGRIAANKLINMLRGIDPEHPLVLDMPLTEKRSTDR
jgi:hypothetical protein